MAISFSSLLNFGSSPKRRQVNEGTHKTLFDGSESGAYTMQFRDTLSPLDNEFFEVAGKGAINNRLSELFMTRLNDMGLETHFIRRLNMSEQLIRMADPYNFRVTVHNVAADEFAERLGFGEHEILSKPVVELSHKSRELEYPVIAPEHVDALDWAGADEVEDIMLIARRVNDFLSGQFFAVGMRLLNVTLEFGRIYQGDYFEESRVLIIDEITPDTCSILDLQTGTRLDGRALGDTSPQELALRYQEVARRFRILGDTGPLELNENFGVIERGAS
ncbi:phosphoribosylaminoimidazolesuccinocarboxamide synthase [Candidatus Odyssella acanthamoebae]|uniref:phosphoribosylaminoimidazolesuccinocarboxamide synthase n=1 Tax=Candidatus Odyssella acanthamoebae TaxID=91604 RepID=UPI00068BED6D|nr:phosphoribosylaminoimidazolesuccinocarboxamide synthase [Candidatus Paracaedibacter acanthamoebae]